MASKQIPKDARSKVKKYRDANGKEITLQARVRATIKAGRWAGFTGTVWEFKQSSDHAPILVDIGDIGWFDGNQLEVISDAH